MVDWIALLIALIALVLVIIFVVIFFVERNRGIPLRIQFGGSGTSDTMNTGGNNLYIVNSTAPSGFVLNIASNSTNIAGSEIYIFNSSGQQITVQGAGVNIIGSTTVGAGNFSQWVFTDNSSNLLRLV